MKDKKSLFEKIKFIEKIPGDPEGTQNMSLNSEDNLSNEAVISDYKETTSATEQICIEAPADTYKEASEEYTPYTSGRIIEVSEIYKYDNITTDSIKSIYIIDSFLKALPETLPNEAKRQSVLNIISASGMNLETLLMDGKRRIDLIRSFHNGFTGKTEEIIKQYETSIEELNAKIQNYKAAISERVDLQKEQDLILEYESQRIENIMKFINKQ